MLKYGKVPAGEMVIVNGHYLLALADFDVYLQGSIFKWEQPHLNGDSFVYYLMVKKFVTLFMYVSNHEVDPPGPCLVHGHLTEKGVERLGDVVREQDFPELLRCLDNAAERTFTIDGWQGIPLGFLQIKEYIDDLDRQALTSQQLGFLIAGINDSKLENAVRGILSVAAEKDSNRLTELIEASEYVETQIGLRRAKRDIDSHGYAVSGYAPEFDTDPTLLYTVGLCNVRNEEFYVEAHRDVELLGRVMRHVAKQAYANDSVEDIQQSWNAQAEKDPKIRILVNRTRKIDKLFRIRVADNFTPYQVTLLK